MSTWVVMATKTASGAWCLEQPELGAVSQVDDLADVRVEMVEAIGYLSGERAYEIEIEVRAE